MVLRLFCRYLWLPLDLVGWKIYWLRLREQHGALGCFANHGQVKIVKEGGICRCWYVYSVIGTITWALGCGNFLLLILDSSSTLCVVEEE